MAAKPIITGVTTIVLIRPYSSAFTVDCRADSFSASAEAAPPGFWSRPPERPAAAPGASLGRSGSSVSATPIDARERPGDAASPAE